MVLNTHLNINETLNGEVVVIKDGYAKVELKVSEAMVADERGLIHGGFIFGAADYAAMAAVNHPNVVLAKSEVKFLAPSKLGDKIILEANIIEQNGAKSTVEVTAIANEKLSFKGLFYTVTLEKHVLDI